MLIRLPVHAHEAARLIHREARAIEKSAGRRPSVRKLAERLSLDARKVEAFLRATAVPTPFEELETEPGIGDPSALDPFEKVASDHLRRTLDDMLAELGHKPEQIVRLRFGLGGADPMMLEAVGYTPRSTLNSRNKLTGKGASSFQTMLIGRSPSADSSNTRPQARYASPLRGRAKSWNCQPLAGLSV